MFGFMEKRRDHETLIASLDAVLPVIVTAGLAPSYYRPFIMGSSMISATCRRAVKGLGVLRHAALGAVADRKKQVEDGVADRYDLLQQMMDISQDEKGKKMDYGYREISCHCWSNMYVPPTYHLITNTEFLGLVGQTLRLSLCVRLCIAS